MSIITWTLWICFFTLKTSNFIALFRIYFAWTWNYTSHCLCFCSINPYWWRFKCFYINVYYWIDRMLGIFFPIWYSMKSEKNYVKKLYLISLIYPLVFVAYVIRSLIQDPFLQVQCFSQDLMGVDGRSLIVGAQLVFNLLTLTCYVLMFFKLIYDQKTGKMCSIRKSIYKSLAIIMGIQIGGYMFSLSAFNILNLIYSNFTNTQSQIIKCLINVVASLSSSIEVPTIFAVSTEHRLAFKDEFSWLINPSSSNKNSKVFILSNKNTIKSIQPQSTLTKTKTNGIVSVGY
uniref:Uncharacterized protein n=1 Tax=Meloidogyne enterolobii TaxID=390850 RepID=A0A6V7V5A2_MELEN|nr:unnamed protein product [Meloidogyne enterolobii]